MTDDELALKAMQDHQAGKPEDDIKKELESNRMKFGYINRSGKFIWRPTN
jgi:hypothetical protein